jgi:hypothetical protein
MIVKLSHLNQQLKGWRADRDATYADANKVQAAVLKVPELFFAGKVWKNELITT